MHAKYSVTAAYTKGDTNLWNEMLKRFYLHVVICEDVWIQVTATGLGTTRVFHKHLHIITKLHFFFSGISFRDFLVITTKELTCKTGCMEKNKQNYFL